MKKYKYIKSHDIYIFNTKNDILHIETELLTQIVYDYITVGNNLSSDELYLRYVNKLNNMTKDDLQSMLSSLGIKKTSYPFLPEECKDNDADRLAAIYISRKSANAIVKSKELEIRELKRQVSTLQHDVSEKVSIAEILNKGFENIDSESYALGAHSASKTCRVICFSDWHVGVEIKSSDLNSDNDYNIDIVKERINKCIEYISNADISEQDEIYIAFLGDMMDGMLSNMKPLMAVEHDLHGIEQLVSASDIIIDLIYRLYKLFDRRMTILTVGGNHDRLTEKKIQDKNRLAHLVLFDRVRLGLKYKVPNANLTFISNNKRWYGYDLINGVRLIINHGDNSAKYDKIVTADLHANTDYRVLLQGHLHKREVLECNNYMGIKVPSLVGVSRFGEGDCCLVSRPGQAIVSIQNNDTLRVNAEWIDL